MTAGIIQVIDIALERTRREGRTPHCIKLGWQEYGRLRQVFLESCLIVDPDHLDAQIRSYGGYRVAIAGQPSLVRVE